MYTLYKTDTSNKVIESFETDYIDIARLYYDDCINSGLLCVINQTITNTYGGIHIVTAYTWDKLENKLHRITE